MRVVNDSSTSNISDLNSSKVNKFISDLNKLIDLYSYFNDLQYGLKLKIKKSKNSSDSQDFNFQNSVFKLTDDEYTSSLNDLTKILEKIESLNSGLISKSSNKLHHDENDKDDDDQLANDLKRYKQSNIKYEIINDVSNESIINQYLYQGFEEFQQLSCKLIAKYWIKLIEPKKQSKFPYKSGFGTKPTWWPVNIRHKEPDHLKKNERIELLISIILNFYNLESELINSVKLIYEFNDNNSNQLNHNSIIENNNDSSNIGTFTIRKLMILKDMFKIVKLYKNGSHDSIKVIKPGKKYTSKIYNSPNSSLNNSSNLSITIGKSNIRKNDNRKNIINKNNESFNTPIKNLKLNTKLLPLNLSSPFINPTTTSSSLNLQTNFGFPNFQSTNDPIHNSTSVINDWLYQTPNNSNIISNINNHTNNHHTNNVKDYQLPSNFFNNTNNNNNSIIFSTPNSKKIEFFETSNMLNNNNNITINKKLDKENIFLIDNLIDTNINTSTSSNNNSFSFNSMNSINSSTTNSSQQQFNNKKNHCKSIGK